MNFYACLLLCVIFSNIFYCKSYILDFADSVCNLLSSNDSLSVFESTCANRKMIKSILHSANIPLSSNEAEAFCAKTKISINSEDGIYFVQFHNILTSIVDLMTYWRRRTGAFIYDEYSGFQKHQTLNYLRKRYIKAVLIPVNFSSTLEQEILESIMHQNVIIVCHPQLLNKIIEKVEILDLFVKNYTWVIVDDGTPEAIFGVDIPPNSQVTLITPQSQPAYNNSIKATTSKLTREFIIQEKMTNLCEETILFNISAISNIDIRLKPQDQKVNILKTAHKIEIYDVFFCPTTSRTESIKFAEWEANRLNRLIMLEEFEPNDKLRLRERRVRVVVFEHLPYSVLTRRKNAPLQVKGYLKDMMETLLINYNVRYTLREIDAVFGIGTNGTYTGMVGVFFRREADLAMNVLAMTNSRATAVRYAGPVTKAHLAILYNRPQAIIPPTTYLMPFNIVVWITMIIIFSSFVIVTFVTLSTSPASNDERHSTLSQKIHRRIFRILTLTYVDEVLEYPVGPAAKVIHGTLLLTTLAVFIHYTSTFTAFLTYQEEKIPFKSVEDVVAKKEFDVLLIKNTRHQDVFQYAPSGPYLDIWKRVVRQGEKSFSQTFESGYTDMCQSAKFVLLTDGPTTTYLSSGNCSVAFAPMKYLEEYYNTPHRTDFPYTKIFTMGLMKILESGILQRLTLSYRLAKRPPCILENTSASFGINQVMGVFFLYACGIILSLIALLVERLLPKRLPQLAIK